MTLGKVKKVLIFLDKVNLTPLLTSRISFFRNWTACFRNFCA